MATKRQVCFIGVCGPSASGKSTISRRLCAALDSPIIPIQADCFFVPDLPPCPCRPWGCWELPASVDSALLLTQMQHVSHILAGAETVPSITIPITKGHTCCLDAEGVVGKKLGAGPIYVVVEGFLLFADPKVASMFSHCLWLDMDCE